MSDLNLTGRYLLDELSRASKQEEVRAIKIDQAEKVNAIGVGEAFTAAYEHLRNAAENAEEHLLLQNAVRRFYKRLFFTQDETLLKVSGNELAIELTYAGYIKNGSLAKFQTTHITKLAEVHYKAYEKALSNSKNNPDTIMDWLLDTLSADVTTELVPQFKDVALVSAIHQYFDNLIRQGGYSDEFDSSEFGAALFVAIHRAILKSSQATIRSSLLNRYGISPENHEHYFTYNKHIDNLLVSATTDKLYHIVNRQGAPFRVLRKTVAEQPESIDQLTSKKVFLKNFKNQIAREYTSIIDRINRAIIRSVIFLIVTKIIVGIAMEIPYDLWAHGEIIWLPLIINLFFPPIYMVALRSTLQAPGSANTKALVARIDSILYGDDNVVARKLISQKQFSPVFSIIYAISSLGVFAGVVWLLLALRFEIVHILIFFLFISTASFLGFRLSRLVRDLEIVRSASNGLTFLRDAIYLPFVAVGQWMSEKYAKINVVALILDTLIELPLKTLFRLIRQWSAFIDERKDLI